VLRWAPKVWSHLFRDAGLLQYVAVSPDAARLELAGLADEVMQGPAWLDGSAGAVGAVFDILGVDGTVELDGPHRTSRSAVMRVAWKLDRED
jgi:hypothetical protein